MWRTRALALGIVCCACGARSQLDVGSVRDAALDAPTVDGNAIGDADVRDVLQLAPVLGISTNGLTCIVQAVGNVKCWGNAPVGDGTDTVAYAARLVPAASPSVRVVTLNSATCALRADAPVDCWGTTPNLELGLGFDTSPLADDAGNVAFPTNLSGLSATTISAGRFNACAVGPTGQATCWGSDLSHQTGFPE